MIICDFCSNENVTRRYKCPSFKMLDTPEYTHWSEGDWAACDTCAELIDAGKLPELTERSLEAFVIFPMLDTEEKAAYREMLTNAHQRFDKEKD